MTLKNQISALAEQLTQGVLAAIRSASLEELLAEGGRAPSPRASASSKASAPAVSARAPKRKAGRLARRSPEQISQVIDSIVGALKKNKSGLRSEQLQKILKLDKREIFGPLNEALEKKKISKKGQRRATTYFAA